MNKCEKHTDEEYNEIISLLKEHKQYFSKIGFGDEDINFICVSVKNTRLICKFIKKISEMEEGRK